MSIKRILSIISFKLLIILLFNSCESEPGNSSERTIDETPALVIGIMVDQMRPDFIYRYWGKFGDDGFKRLVNEGFSFTNAHFEYVPTATGPGHASVYGGTTPSVHGVVSNSVHVPGYEGVGSAPGYNGSVGPGNMLTTTVGDELRLHTNFRSKVVSISRKDRGAIIPAGHTGDAYWYEEDTGNFITSTYYRDSLPEWVQEFNDRSLPQQYLSEPWETILPIEEYIESIDDDNPYEWVYPGQEAPVFPHDLPTLAEEVGPGVLIRTPFHDKMLTELAIAAIEGESLGSGETTDILAISYSALDSVGHRYGPASVEIQEIYMRLDRYLARLFNYLDDVFGQENILLFLTSDHGVAHIPQYLMDHGIPAGYFDTSPVRDALGEYLTTRYGENFVSSFGSSQIRLDHDFIDRNNLDHGEIQREVARFMLRQDGIGGALTAEALNSTQFTDGIRKRIQNGFHQKRSGDIMIWLEPQWIGRIAYGTSHGSLWNYDTHAPMHWYGWNIPAGRSTLSVTISDMAPTVATFLNSPLPSGTIGKPLNDFMK